MDAALAAWAALEAAVGPPPAAPGGEDGAVARFAEQFVVDVAGITDELRAEALGALGDDAFAFVQAVWVEDLGRRLRHAFDALLGEAPVPVAEATEAPWPAQERFLREVALLDALDPLTAELVRLRGAAAHGCRLCRSLRNRTAVAHGGDDATFAAVERFESSDLAERHKVALRLVDAIVWTPAAYPAGLAEQVRATFDRAEVVELVLDVARNAANKLAVAFAADAPHVESGIELYDIDPATGDPVYGLGFRVP